jgi:general secretion pathway protein G
MQSRSPCTANLTSIKSLNGFTLVELVMTIGIVAIMSTIAVSSYRTFIEKTEYELVFVDLKQIEGAIEQYYIVNGSLPPNIDAFNLKDPWGNEYKYLNMDLAKGNGKKRKDKNLVPINDDYDLYSMGPDGRSVSPLTAKHSQDDIIRANNGAFIGKAEDY